MSSRPKQPVVFVTGTSSGIGLALARLLWKTQYRVVVTARKIPGSPLEDPPFRDTDRFLLRTLDVTSPNGRESLVQEIGERWGGIDILVNNAGISYRSVLEHMTDEDEQNQLQANYFGPMALTRLVLAHMRKQRWGRIINISSVGGMMAMPTMGSYNASKFALEGASEALWYEMKPWNVKVSLVQVGFTRSDSYQKVYWSERAKVSSEALGDYAIYYKNMSRFIEKLMLQAPSTPESIARKIVRVMNQRVPSLRVPATPDAYLFYYLRRLLPRAIYHLVLYYSLPGIRRWGKSDKSSVAKDKV